MICTVYQMKSQQSELNKFSLGQRLVLVLQCSSDILHLVCPVNVCSLQAFTDISTRAASPQANHRGYCSILMLICTDETK